jgi:hypothetical protein
MLGFPDDRRSRQPRGQPQQAHNPFEMMDSQMNHMMQRMDTMMGGGFGGGPFGGHGGSRHPAQGSAHDMMGSMFSSMDQMMGSMRAGGIGAAPSLGGSHGGAYSYSSCSYCSSSSNGGPAVEYSSSSHGMQRPGEAPVHETHRNYRDSAGNERLGVSRHIGDRGRSVVAERNADGRETRTDNLINVDDGTAFDREWRGHAGATAIGQARANTRVAPTMLGGPAGFSALPMGGGRHAESHHPRLTDADRAAAREGARQHQVQRDRMIQEARRQRDTRPPSHRAGGPLQIDHRSRHASDAHMASRLAEQEARRAGLY